MWCGARNLHSVNARTRMQECGMRNAECSESECSGVALPTLRSSLSEFRIPYSTFPISRARWICRRGRFPSGSEISNIESIARVFRIWASETWVKSSPGALSGSRIGPEAAECNRCAGQGVGPRWPMTNERNSMRNCKRHMPGRRVRHSAFSVATMGPFDQLGKCS